jgi:hypothetical protein
MSEDAANVINGKGYQFNKWCETNFPEKQLYRF